MPTPRKTSQQPGSQNEWVEQPGSGAVPSHGQHDELAGLGAELLRRAAESQPALERAWDELMARWGVHGQPLGVEQLRALVQQESGANPEDCAFSRDLIALREARRP